MKKILILSANPTNTDKLRLDEEVREIQAGLERAKNREKFEVISRWALRPDDLRRALLDFEPEIVHFSGHGAGNQGLALENNAGNIQLVSTESLARLFKLFKDKVECVLLEEKNSADEEANRANQEANRANQEANRAKQGQYQVSQQLEQKNQQLRQGTEQANSAEQNVHKLKAELQQAQQQAQQACQTALISCPHNR